MTKQLDEPGDRDEGYAPLQNYAPLQGAVEDDEGDAVSEVEQSQSKFEEHMQKEQEKLI